MEKVTANVNNRMLYRAKVRRDHKHKVVQKYFDLYQWFWFHTEFWLAPEERRPYTYIMRDWIFPHKGWFYLISAVWFLLLGLNHSIPAYIVAVLTAFLWGHLVWGSPWIKGQKV